jgi:hypothetical protein
MQLYKIHLPDFISFYIMHLQYSNYAWKVDLAPTNYFCDSSEN